MATDFTVRTLTAADLPAAWRLGRDAFGGPAEPPARALTVRPATTQYGAFDGGGGLVGRAIDLHDGQWWSGRPVPAADVAGVAVAPAWRGRGVGRALLAALLAGARGRGAAVSALFPTVAAPYRAAGWEVCGTRREYRVAASALPWHRPGDGLTVHDGGPADEAEVHALYTRVARHRAGPLTRVGGRFAPADAAGPADVGGLTVVRRSDVVVAYARWERGSGYGTDGVLAVEDLAAAEPAAARALVGVLAGWQSVTPVLRLAPLAYDALSPVLPWEVMAEHEAQPWMHRPVDVVRAVAARGWPGYARGEATFTLADPVCPWNTGTWRLRVEGGDGALTPASPTEATPELTVGGFAQLYCGVATGAGLVEAGMAEAGPAEAEPVAAGPAETGSAGAGIAGSGVAALDLLACGGPAQLPDYF
ncbi:hypothetical protein GCM10010124_17620 [Pilimelia terevasa]|uniref:N-acetyltransferase domain-containing protein n=1 Tax=Pilimelia terevasa TaxID=53372 RepID=A0A8J3BKA0_9ACTN|nr:GNAT family N-acetyltransferase [Pilimelia terevasa]GGK25555.1 hypothetical protein GCM10010124_17620 [Pilimelia terevasa]